LEPEEGQFDFQLVDDLILEARKNDLGYFKDGEWIVYRHLNGDQTHQGRHIRSFVDDVSIQRFTLYEYD